MTRIGVHQVYWKSIVQQWPKVAKSLRIAAREQQRLASAFRLAG